MQLESLYQEIILDHYRHPHHKGLRGPYDAEVRHVNPTCGDEVTLRVALKDAGVEPIVADISYDALGCSISQASVSVLSDLIIGKPVSEALATCGQFVTLMQSRGEAQPDEDVLGDAAAHIDMTLASAACPLTDVIEDQAGAALEGLVPDFRINWVWMPPWGPDKITEDGREQLRALGFNV